MNILKSGAWRIVLAGVIGGIFFTVILCWNLVRNVNNYFVDIGDYQFNGWVLLHNFESWKNGTVFNQSEYFNTKQFYPLPNTLAYSETLFVPGVFFSIIYWLNRSWVTSVNFYTLFSFGLSFSTTFICLYYILKNWRPAIVGAFVYSFNFLTFGHLFQGHLQLSGKYFLFPLFLSSYYFVTSPNIKNAFFCGLMVTLNALTTVYFFLMFVMVMLIVFSFYFGIVFKKEGYEYPIKLMKSGWVMLIFIPVLWYFLSPYFLLSRNELPERPVGMAKYFSARMWDWFMANPNSSIYGTFVYSAEWIRMKDELPDFGFNYGEHSLFLQVVPSLLAATGVLKLYFDWRKKNGFEYGRRWWGYWLGVGIISWFLSWSWLADIWHTLLPFMQGIRAPSRFVYIFYVPFSLVAAYGSVVVFGRFRKTDWVLAGILLLLVIENLQNFKYDLKSNILTEYNKQGEYRMLVGKALTYHSPAYFNDQRFSGYYQNLQSLSGETTVSGYSGYYPADWVNFVSEVDSTLSEKAIRKVKALGVKYLIFHPKLMNEQQKVVFEAKSKELAGEKVYEDKEMVIYNLKNLAGEVRVCGKGDSLNYFFNGPVVTVENSLDCFWVSKFEERYVNKPGGRLPVVIAPGEKYTVQRI